MKSHAIFAAHLLKNSFSSRYVRKQKGTDTSKDELYLGDDDVEAFSGSQADLERAAENLFSFPPHPQLLHFETLSLKTPDCKIESKLEKSLGTHLNMQQQMVGFRLPCLRRCNLSEMNLSQ